jgi:hypothetical protein
MEVYKAIAAVQGELAKVGISKDRRNTQGTGYNFRGIDDVYAALAPLLAKNGLCVIPRMTERSMIERTTKNGGAIFYTTVKAEFDFVAVADGSKHTACTYGEAMDTSDKSTNKAMSAAYKYAAFLTFAIPTDGDNDADAATHEVQARTTISNEQFAELSDLVERTNTDLEPLCKYYKIDALAMLPAAKFGHCKAQLAKKIKPEQEAA